MAMLTGKRGEINVTPLIDVLLVLLIIFMIIIPQQSVGLPTNVPQPATNAQPDPQPRDIVVAVRADGTLAINTQPVPWEELEERLRRIFAQRVNGVLFLAGAPSVEFREIARVIDTAREVGVVRIALLPRGQGL
jgi:biopolymer transport protein TolR